MREKNTPYGVIFGGPKGCVREKNTPYRSPKGSYRSAAGLRPEKNTPYGQGFWGDLLSLQAELAYDRTHSIRTYTTNLRRALHCTPI